jgi:hypothetical protein
LLLTLVGYLVLWVLARRGLGALGHNFFTGILLPTVIVAALFPLEARFAFMAFGMKITKSAAAH